MRRRAHWLLLALSNSTCTAEHQAVVLDVPDGVDFVALITVDEQGSVLEGSTLTPHTSGTPLGLAASADRATLLIGYSGAQLGAYPRDGLTRDSPAHRLRSARGCEARLPVPTWAARWAESGDFTEEPPPARPMTTDFVQTVCPDPGQYRISIDQRCQSERCAVHVTGTNGCVVELDLAECRLGAAHVSFDAYGAGCLELLENADACALGPGGEASRVRLECREPVSCDYDVHATSQTIDDGLVVERVAPYAAEKYQHSTLARNILPLPRGVLLVSGYTLDVLPLEDRLVAVSVSDRFPIQECVRLEPILLTSYDLETLAPIATSTLPPCVHRLLADPIGPGFVGPFFERSTWRLGRFDPDGRRRLSAPAGGTGPEGSRPYFGSAFDVTEIDRTAAGDAIVLLFSRKLEDTSEVPRAALAVYDTTSLQLLHLHELEDQEEPRSMAMQGREAILPSARTRRVRWIDVSSGEVKHDVPIPEMSLALSSFAGVMAGPSSGEAFVALTGAERAVAHLPAVGAVRRLIMYESDFDTIAFGAWPWQPGLQLASGTIQVADGDWHAGLALFDPAEQRFLPGSVSLGPGIVSRIRTDTKGRLYFLLPWRPEIIRWSQP